MASAKRLIPFVCAVLLTLLTVLGTAGVTSAADTWTVEYTPCGGTVRPAYLYVEGTYAFIATAPILVLQKRAGNWEPVGNYGEVTLPADLPPINGFVSGAAGCIDKAYAWATMDPLRPREVRYLVEGAFVFQGWCAAPCLQLVSFSFELAYVPFTPDPFQGDWATWTHRAVARPSSDVIASPMSPLGPFTFIGASFEHDGMGGCAGKPMPPCMPSYATPVVLFRGVNGLEITLAGPMAPFTATPAIAPVFSDARLHACPAPCVDGFGVGMYGPAALTVTRIKDQGMAVSLDQLVADLDVATLSVTRIRNAAKTARNYVATGNIAGACSLLRSYHKLMDAQDLNAVSLEPADELDAAGAQAAAALGCR